MRLATVGRFVRGAGEFAAGHANAGGGEHLLAEPFGLRALAELGQALDRLRRGVPRGRASIRPYRV